MGPVTQRKGLNCNSGRKVSRQEVHWAGILARILKLD